MKEWTLIPLYKTPQERLPFPWMCIEHPNTSVKCDVKVIKKYIFSVRVRNGNGPEYVTSLGIKTQFVLQSRIYKTEIGSEVKNRK